MGNLLSLENCQKYPSCEYCGTFPTDDNHVLLVHHKGKLNGRSEQIEGSPTPNSYNLYRLLKL